MGAHDPRDTLWQNICALMGEPSPTLDAVQARTKVGRGTVQRIRDRDTGTRLTSLIAIADRLGVELWQLFVPDLDPAALPELHQGDNWTPDERALVRAWRHQRAARESTAPPRVDSLDRLKRALDSRDEPMRLRIAKSGQGPRKRGAR